MTAPKHLMPLAFPGGYISLIPGALSLQSCLTTSATSSRETEVDPPSSFSSVLNVEGGLVGFRSSSKCPFQRPLTPSVRVNSVPPLLYTAWMLPYFPLLGCWIVFQKHLGTDWKSLSMASPNSSHTCCFASTMTKAAILWACGYLATAYGVPLDNISWKDSSFSRTTSLSTGVHQDVWGLTPLEAPMNLRPQLSAAALQTLGTGSMSPTSTGMPEMLCLRWDLKATQTVASSKHSQFTPLHQDFPFFWPKSSLDDDLGDSSALSSHKCPRHAASDQIW